MDIQISGKREGHRLERVHISEKREGHSLERVMEEPRDRLQREARMRCPPHPCKVVVLLTIALLTLALPTLARLLIALPTPARQLNCLAFSPVCVLNVSSNGFDTQEDALYIRPEAPDGIRTRRALGSSLNCRQDCHHMVPSDK